MMLFLTKEDIAGIDRRRIQDAVRKAYGLMASGEFNMPDRVHVEDQDNALLFMPCFAGKYFGTKLVTVFPGASTLGAPVVNGLMTLSDNETGRPLAAMDGAALTAARTGAVGGVAVDVLADASLKTAGIFGAGVQGHSQARYLLLNRELDRLLVFDLDTAAAVKMAQDLSEEFPEVSFQVVQEPDTLVQDAELIIAATTSRTPLFSDDNQLVAGKYFISIGSFRPDMREFPDAVIQSAGTVYVDTPFAAKESGDICIPLKAGKMTQDNVVPFAPLASGDTPLPFDSAKGRTLFFKSVGMALFDLMAASELYELALADKLGVTLEF